MPYIIGTAGHIDHGKTSLVKALTGEDTDRLKEEKERGISIDLGFAHLDLPDGTQAGVVDVPGHERFIRNMLAGAHGMDLVLFTVAADDGVMPQTEEHLDIVHLLGIERAIFVITKADLAPERISAVEQEIRVLTSGTSLEGSPILACSSVTGEGLDPLRAEIVRVLRGWEKHRSQAYFRLPVDRAFLLQGHGVIVTGTALSGRVAVGDRVRCLPGGQLLRVRSLQVHNQPRDAATGGQRVALNLTGEERTLVERGHVICHEKITLTTDRFDAQLEVRPTAVKGIRNHQRVRIHVGTAERLGKLIVLGPADQMGPKQRGYCQIALSEPVVALRGDRFVVRDETARQTLGGGLVIHPWPAKHKRTDPDLLEKMTILQRGDPADATRIILDESDAFAVPIDPLYQFLNVEETDARRTLEHAAGIRVIGIDTDLLYTTDAKWRHLTDSVLAALRAFHAARPLEAGCEMEALRTDVADRIPTRVFRACVEQLEKDNVLARSGNLLRLRDHAVRLKDDERELAERITRLLVTQPIAPPDVKQIEQEIGVARSKLTEILRVMERERSIVRIAPDMYFMAEAIEKVKVDLGRHLTERGTITAAAFRDLFGTSRKYAIPLLEYFDREGLTVRVGDARRLKNPRTVMDTR